MWVWGIPCRHRQVLLLAGDSACLLLALYGAHLCRLVPMGGWPTLIDVIRDVTGGTILFGGIQLILLYITDSYAVGRDFRRPDDAVCLVAAIGIACLLQFAAFYFLPWWSLWRSVALLSQGFFVVLLFPWRMLTSWLTSVPAQPRFTLVLGEGSAATQLLAVLRMDADRRRFWPVMAAVSVEAARGRLADLTQQHGITHVVVAVDESLDADSRQELMQLKGGVHILEMTEVYSRLTGSLPLRALKDSALLYARGFCVSHPARVLVRAVDLTIATVVLIGLAPLLFVAAIALKLDSRGPVIYAQERLGERRRPFTLFKLRTMVANAEHASGPVWAAAGCDGRVTRVGRWLRRTRIDELPQLVNVMLGDMALVGPRPERAFFVKRLLADIPYYVLRFAVKPGLTGWAQVTLPYAASVEDSERKLERELYAIVNMNPALYAMILVKTLQVVAAKPGS